MAARRAPRSPRSPRLPRLPKRALLFDLDGTLADTAPDLGAALNHALATRDLPPIRPVHYRPLVGGGAASLVQAALDWHGLALPPREHKRLVAALLDFYRAHIADRTRLFAHLSTCLRRFRAAGIGLAVVSNKREDLARLVLEKLGAASFFALIVGGDTLAQKKPDPAPIQHALRALGSAPDHAVMIGDSEQDIGAARRAGCAVICVRFGYHPHFLPRSPAAPPPQADGILDSYANLPRLLAQIAPQLFAPEHSAQEPFAQARPRRGR